MPFMVPKKANSAHMIDLVGAAGPGCRQTANEVIFLNADSKQDSSSRPPRVSLGSSPSPSVFCRDAHTSLCVSTVMGGIVAPRNGALESSPQDLRCGLAGRGGLIEGIEVKQGP